MRIVAIKEEAVSIASQIKNAAIDLFQKLFGNA